MMQANTGHNNVQLGVVHGNVQITQVIHPPCDEQHGRERTLALRGLALAPISAAIAAPAQPALGLGLLALGVVFWLLSAPTWSGKKRTGSDGLVTSSAPTSTKPMIEKEER